MFMGHLRHRDRHPALALLVMATALLWSIVSGASIKRVNGSYEDITADKDTGIIWTSNNMPVNVIEKYENTHAEFYCGIQASPTNTNFYRQKINIVWLKDGSVIDFKRRKSTYRRHGWSLSVEQLKPDDSGNYTCIASADDYQLQWTFFLRVLSVLNPPQSVPLIAKGLSNQTAHAGTTVTFECTSLVKSSTEMIWAKLHLINGSYGSGPPIAGDPHVTILKNWSLTHSDLVIENVKKEDEGCYLCGFKNRLGSVYESAYLTVVEAKQVKDDKESAFDEKTIIITSACLFVFLVVIVTISSMVLRYHTRKLKMTQYKLYHKNEVPYTEPLVKPRRFSSRSSTSSYPSSGSSRSSVPPDDMFEFPRNRLTIQDTIGEGAFGVVKKAIAFGVGRIPTKANVVAVKSLKDGATQEEKHEFLKEVEVMKSIKKLGDHINIVNFLGCCTQNGPLYVIVEFCKKGNLRDYLLLFRTYPNRLSGWSDDGEIYMQGMEGDEANHAKNMLSQKVLLSFGHQIARGMEFLSKNKTIHRDLAARNVLVTENNILKIADFGLARNGDYYKKTSKGQIPIKWMPPEALMDLKYTEKSDVWSFGIVLWEIFTLGGMPYPTIPHEDLYNRLIEGYRLDKPPLSPDSLYDTMRRCWFNFPDERPDFKTLVLIMERHLVRVSNGGYLEVMS